MDTFVWLSCKWNNFRFGLWRLFVRVRFVITGDCGLNCGMATFRKLDGTPFQQFVPEADCPIHDLGLKSPASEPKVRYIGWIKGEIGDAERLKELGVCGEMNYRAGIFGYCEVDEETMDRLEKSFPGFWRGSFSVISDQQD